MTQPINDSARIKTSTQDRWRLYNQKMAPLFAERNRFPSDCPERDAAAQRILDLWIAEGE